MHARKRSALSYAQKHGPSQRTKKARFVVWDIIEDQVVGKVRYKEFEACRLSRSRSVLFLSLFDPLLERLGLVQLRSGKAVAFGVGSAVRVPHAIGNRALVGRRGSVQLGVVLARVGVGALHLLPIGRTGQARTLSRERHAMRS